VRQDIEERLDKPIEALLPIESIRNTTRRNMATPANEKGLMR
jgi:hypothetical protein